MRSFRSTLLLLVAVLVLIAPSRAEFSRAADDNQQTVSSKPVWLYHLPGIGGLMGIDKAVTAGILSGGVDAKVEIYDWTGTDRGLAALTNVKRHEEQARIVSQRLAEHARAASARGQRVIITSHSAGTGIAITALEKLPDDVMIDDLVIIASALSPEYDLSRALKHVRNKCYAFNSELDMLVLGTGTKMFGTFDRVKTDAGGRVGFVVPREASDRSQYDKLVQFPYDADWMRFHNAGEHIGAMSRTFGREVIARVLLGKGLPPRETPATQPATTQRSAADARR